MIAVRANTTSVQEPFQWFRREAFPVKSLGPTGRTDILVCPSLEDRQECLSYLRRIEYGEIVPAVN